MEYIFDSHAHLNDSSFSEDRDAVIASLFDPRAPYLSGFVEIATDLPGSEAAIALSGRYPGVYAAVGFHPDASDKADDAAVAELRRMISRYRIDRKHIRKDCTDRRPTDVSAEVVEERMCSARIVAIGEIGLDYHWLPKEGMSEEELARCDPGAEIQRACFRRMLALSVETGLPVNIHSRDAGQDTYEILDAFCTDVNASDPCKDPGTGEGTDSGRNPDIRQDLDNGPCRPGKAGKQRIFLPGGILHCFGYSRELAERFVKLGMHIGIGGVLTFKNARKLREVAEAVPLERIVLETDCPYMAPEPRRGTRNDPRNLRYVAAKLAEIKGIPVDEVIRVTRDNALRVYRISS